MLKKELYREGSWKFVEDFEELMHEETHVQQNCCCMEGQLQENQVHGGPDAREAPWTVDSGQHRDKEMYSEVLRMQAFPDLWGRTQKRWKESQKLQDVSVQGSGNQIDTISTHQDETTTFGSNSSYSCLWICDPEKVI